MDTFEAGLAGFASCRHVHDMASEHTHDLARTASPQSARSVRSDSVVNCQRRALVVSFGVGQRLSSTPRTCA